MSRFVEFTVNGKKKHIAIDHIVSLDEGGDELTLVNLSTRQSIIIDADIFYVMQVIIDAEREYRCVSFDINR